MNAETLYRMARHCVAEDELNQALEHLTESLAIQEYSMTHCLVAEVHLRLGDSDLAFTHAERAYTLNPVHDDSSVLFAELLAQRGQKHRALQIAREILARNVQCGPAQMLVMVLEE